MQTRDKAKTITVRASAWDRLLKGLKLGKTVDELEDIMANGVETTSTGDGEETPGEGTHVHIHHAESTGDENEARFQKLEQGHQMIMDRLDEMMGNMIGDKARDEEEEEEEEGKKKPKDKKGKDKAKDTEEEEEEKKAKDEENKKIEGELEIEAPPGTGDKARKARDSEYLEDSFQETVAMAEVIVPGIGVPTFDRAFNPKKGLELICNLRSKALDLAWSHSDTREIIEQIIGAGKTLDARSLTCDAARTLFRSVATNVRNANNGSLFQKNNSRDNGVKKRVSSIAELNEINRKKYGQV